MKSENRYNTEMSQYMRRRFCLLFIARSLGLHSFPYVSPSFRPVAVSENIHYC